MYLINGQFQDDCTLDGALHQLYLDLPERLAKTLDTATVLGAAAAFAKRLQDSLQQATDKAIELAEQKSSKKEKEVLGG